LIASPPPPRADHERWTVAGLLLEWLQAWVIPRFGGGRSSLTDTVADPKQLSAGE
jgi:hypothetical protein